MKKLFHSLFALLPLVAGCSDDGADPMDTTSGGGGATGADTSASVGATTTNGGATVTTGGSGGGFTDYPAGPYGTEVGDTIAFVEFEGFLAPREGDPGSYVDVDMLDVRNSSPAVLLHLAAMF